MSDSKQPAAPPGTMHLPRTFSAILVYSRPVLVFGGMICALSIMWQQNPVVYTIGVSLLLLSMTFDLVDGWFAARFRPDAPLAHLADRLLDKLVYSIIFPVIAVGMMWRLLVMMPDYSKGQLLHAMFVLLLCVVVLIRDNFAAFMRGFAVRQGIEPSLSEYNRLRTMVAAPVSALLYAYAFYVPEGPSSWLYTQFSWLANFPLQGLFFVEILFLVINLGSIAGYCRKYGTFCLDELCLGDQLLRRRILAVFPNALTVMNALMGLLAVFFAYQGRIREAYLMIIGAATFDKLDGALARRLGLTEPLPEEVAERRVNLGGLMDDFADAVSFCIVPGWIFYICLRDLAPDSFTTLPVGLVAILYSVLGLGRLVYFTLDKQPIPGFFKGLPTPAGAMLVLAPLIVFSQAAGDSSPWLSLWGYFSFGLMIFTALLMNCYFIHYLHMGRYMSRNPWLTRLALVALMTVVTPWFGLVCLAFMGLYVVSPLVTWRIDPAEAARESRQTDS
ncbi:MAG: CDP-alcohol phosphatidyltransferase family protein [Desulfobulbaceae bacterium]|nr:CDP-alcohol phosphatidyltransferase family protein [Desulfobulbaceae bacterium]